MLKKPLDFFLESAFWQDVKMKIDYPGPFHNAIAIEKEIEIHHQISDKLSIAGLVEFSDFVREIINREGLNDLQTFVIFFYLKQTYSKDWYIDLNGKQFGNQKYLEKEINRLGEKLWPEHVHKFTWKNFKMELADLDTSMGEGATKEKIKLIEDRLHEYKQEQEGFLYAPDRNFEATLTAELNHLISKVSIDSPLNLPPTTRNEIAPLSLNKKKGFKIDFIRVMNALYEKDFFFLSSGDKPTKKEFFDILENTFGRNLSNYDADLSQSFQNGGIEKNVKIFKDLEAQTKEIIENKQKIT
ncbi:MAG: hypothetical protein H6581_03895 [Bacteroidia bacterium]|nr:hypothetical protein [Bacteroidia bacterium]